MWRPRLALGAMLLGSVAPLSALSQNSERAVSTAFISSDLEFNDNYDLRRDSAGDAIIWTNTLGFGLQQRTRTDTLDLGAQGSVRAADLPVKGSEVSADNPIVTLDYLRNVDDSRIGLNLRAQQADVDFFDPLGDLDDDGGFDDTRGGGTRTSLRGNLLFGFNEDGPLSLTGFAQASDISFTDTQDPDLYDRRTLRGGAEIGLRVSPILRFTTGASYANEKFDDSDQLDRDTSRADVGMDARLNQRTTLSARLGYSRVESQRLSGDTTEEGVVGDLSLVFDEKTGQTSASFSSIVDENGERYSFSIGKQVAWDNAVLDGSIGVSTNADTDLRLIGGVDYSLEGRNNRLTLGLRQTASTDEDGRNVLNTNGRVEFIQLLTPVSSMGIDIAGGLTRYENSTQGNTERLNVTAQYNHSLTEDWAMNMGYRFRQTQSDTDDDAQSNAVFVGLSRSFETTR
jgi:hypothetical protein